MTAQAKKKLKEQTDIPIRFIPVDSLVPGDDVRPLRETDPKMKELAQSIAVDGVIEPVIVRERWDAPGEFEIAAGRRRHFASRMAGKETVPCIVRDLTDDDMFRIRVVENLQRDDLRPLEEAEHVRQCLDRGWTIEQTANDLGKSPSWVARRAQLTKLSGDWKNAIADDKQGVSTWSASHLEEIARLPEETQARLLEEYQHNTTAKYQFQATSGTTVSELKSEISHSLHLLKHAKWNLDDELLTDAGPCSTCPKRSDCQPALFEDLHNKKAKKAGDDVHCLDDACWETKRTAFLRRRLKELREQHEKLIVLKDYECYSVTRCKKSAEGAYPCFVNSGEKAGTFFWAQPSQYILARINEKKKTSSGANASTPKNPKVSHEDQVKQVERERVMAACDQIVSHIKDILSEKREAVAATEEQRLAFVLAAGFEAYEVQTSLDKYAEYAALDTSTLIDRMFAGSVKYALYAFEDDFERAEVTDLDALKPICELFGIDLEPIKENVIKAHPLPEPPAKKAPAKKKAAKKKAAA